MFLSMLALSLAFAGYMFSNPWMIVAGIVVGIIAVRRTVFSFNKLGTLVNFIVIIVAVTLGILSITGDENDKQEVAKANVPGISNEQAVVKPAPAHTPTFNTPAVKTILKTPLNKDEILEGIPLSKSDLEEMPCVEQADLDQIILGKNNINTFLIKICANTEFVFVFYDKSMYWERVMWEFWLEGVTQIFNNEFLSSIIEREDGIVLMIPKTEEMKKSSVDYVIVRFYYY